MFYDPRVTDLRERERLRQIWELIPYRPGSSTLRPEPNGLAYASLENASDNLPIGNTDRVTSSVYNSDDVVDNWMLSYEQAPPSPVLTNTLPPFALPQSESLWHGDISSSNNAEVIENNYHWLTDSLAFIRCNPFYVLECALKKKYLVIKLENIPWSVSVDDIKREFNRYILPSPDELDHSVHIMMDIFTGKTESKAFLQMVDCDQNHKLLKKDNKTRIIHFRRIRWSVCPQDEFLRTLYPNWPGTFEDGKAVLSTDEKSDPIFVTQRELQSLSDICRNYKFRFNRKSGERPFFYMKSLILNLPWHQERIITTAQRDILYESYKITARYMAEHSKKRNTPFGPDTVSQFVRPALECCGFTPKQRRSILLEANVQCPPELAYSIQDPILPQSTNE